MMRPGDQHNSDHQPWPSVTEGMSGNEAVDALVRDYLISRGYNKAAAELAQESAHTTSGEAPATSIVAKHLLSTMAEDLYILGLKDKSASSFFVGYDLLRSWAVTSIDVVKNQLLSVTFPIFVHCYLGMVRLGFQSEAQEFVARFKSDHIEHYPEELHQLCSLTSQDQYNSPDYISSSPFIAAAISAKFIVRLSALAYNLLSLFLVQSDLVLVASIINNKVSFKKLEDSHTSVDGGFASDDLLLVELPGYTPGTRSSTAAEFESIPLGVPGSIPKLQHLLGTPSTTTTLSAAHVSLPSTKEEGLYRDLVNKIVRPKAVVDSLAKRRRTARQGSAGAMRSEAAADAVQVDDTILDNAERLGAFSIEAAVVEVTELTADAAEGEQDRGAGRTGSRREAEPKLNRGVALEPSIVFATVTNAYEGMTCLDINPTVTQMAAGHRDSCVRVWRLNPAETTHFGRYLKTRETGGDWEMREVLPKTKRMLQEDSAKRAYGGNKSINGREEGHSSGHYPLLELHGHSRAVYGVSQDSSRGGADRLILSCSADETVRLWDTAVSQCVGKYSCVSPAWCVAFSPVGYHFASGNQDHTATVYATDRIAPLRLLVGHTSDVNCVSWHANATLLATGSDDKTARLWDVRSSHSARLLRGSTAPLSCTAVSPVGNLLAAGADNGKVYVWDLTTTRPLAVLQGHSGAVHSIAFSSDGAALTSGGADCSVRVWDLQEVIDTQIKLLPAAGSAAAASGGANTSATSSSGSGSSARAAANASLLGIAKTAYLDAPHLLVRPQHTFFTKFSPVFHVGYTAQNLLYAGGPFSQVAATAAHLVPTSTGTKGTDHHHLSSSTAEALANTVTEQDTVSALGISHAVPSAH